VENIIIKNQIMVEIIFYNKGQHCKNILPDLNNKQYCPHLVVKRNNKYLGIQFIEGENIVFGKTIFGIVECIYEGIDYDELKSGVKSFIKEGENRVGEGKVI
jgi:hypothetical protein